MSFFKAGCGVVQRHLEGQITNLAMVLHHQDMRDVAHLPNRYA